MAQVIQLTKDLLQKSSQVTAKKATGLVPNSMKLPDPEFFQGKRNRESVRTFINACETYFKLTAVRDENM